LPTRNYPLGAERGSGVWVEDIDGGSFLVKEVVRE